MRSGLWLAYDLVGGAMTVGVAAAGLWLGLLRPQVTPQMLSGLQTKLAQTNASLRSAEVAERRQVAELNSLKEEIASRGALPARSPVESDLRTITHLATLNGLEVVKVTPISGQTYPGITELRFSMEARATFQGLIGFLSDFRKESFWADISQLRVGGGSFSPTREDDRRTASFVVSLFASKEDETKGL